MQKSIAKESPRRIARRLGAAGVALAAVLVLPACHEARGGGYIGDPVDSGVVGVYGGDAEFGFNFQCDDGVKGQITYHDDPSSITLVGDTNPTLFPEIRLHGTVENVLIDADGDPFTEDVTPAATCEEVVEAQAAHFEGSYRSQDTTLSGRGQFNVFVWDEGEPSRVGGIFDGDGFSIDLKLGPYKNYTRAGFIEGGNIQVDN
jgi:hypothetical protein